MLTRAPKGGKQRSGNRPENDRGLPAGTLTCLLRCRQFTITEKIFEPAPVVPPRGVNSSTPDNRGTKSAAREEDPGLPDSQLLVPLCRLAPQAAGPGSARAEDRPGTASNLGRPPSGPGRR